MNFGIDCREKKPSLSARIVPLLVLTGEWSRFGEEAFSQTDLLLLLLQSLQAVCSSAGEVPTLNSLKCRVKQIDTASLFQSFTKTLEETAQELTSFLDLFDRLAVLFIPASENSVPVLDADCIHSVLGIFVRHCVLECKKLTFSQLTRFHSEWQRFVREERNWDLPLRNDDARRKKTDSETDFTAALRELILPEREEGGRKGTKIVDSQGLGSEALSLASLHGRFGHWEEGTFALEEAIRLAQQNNNSLLLEHTLAWLHKSQPSSGEDATVILTRFIKNAENLKLPLLGSWGKLQLAKTQLSLAHSPKSVLQTLMQSETSFSSVYEDRGKKASQKSSTLALQAGTWKHYGYRLQELLYSQLQCHMTSCDALPEGTSAEEKEAFVLSVCAIARHLAETDNFQVSKSLLQTAKNHFSGTGLPYKLLCQCEEEVEFDRAILEENFSLAKRHLRNIATFDQHDASYRSAVLSKAEGNLYSALQESRTLLETLSKSKQERILLQAKLLVLCAGIHAELGFPALGMPHALKCIALCEKHHLHQHQTKLCLAQIQLQLGSPKHCLALVRECLLCCQANGSLLERGLAYFLLAQATLCSKNSGSLANEDVLTSLPLLTQAVSDFRKCSAKDLLKKSLILQGQLYNFVGYIGEREKTAKLIVKLEHK